MRFLAGGSFLKTAHTEGVRTGRVTGHFRLCTSFAPISAILCAVLALCFCPFAIAGLQSPGQSIVPPKDTAYVICYDSQDRELLSYEDHDGDGRFETQSYFQQGRLERREKDSSGDGISDQVVYFDENGLEQKAEIDTNHDGKIDRWQYYRYGKPESIEADLDADGRVDLRSRYTPDGALSIIEEDRDRDGIFELVQQYDSQGWERIVVNDPGREGCPVVTLYYRGESLEQKEVDLDRDGKPEVMDLFRKDGTLRERCEYSSDGKRFGGPCPIRFVYGPAGDMVIRAERDCDGDGQPEERYYYSDGKLSTTQEHRIHSEETDVGHHYDNGEERPVVKEKDLDGDGRVDLIE